MHMLRHGLFIALTLVGIVVTSVPALAQHTHEPLPTPAQHEHQPDRDAVSLFAQRDASGTAWLPDATPMYGVHRTRGAWEPSTCRKKREADENRAGRRDV
jgi:hypothetical protein